jgi:ABC-type enterochelin transport system permease subunit
MFALIWIMIKLYLAGVVVFGGWTFVLCQALGENDRALKKPYELVVAWPLTVAGALILGVELLRSKFFDKRG